MNTLTLIIVLVAVWLGLVLLFRLWIGPLLSRGMGTNPKLGFIYYMAKFLSLFWHRLEGVGVDIPPKTNHPGGLIVVANHTGALDPIIIQVLCRFHIRWMMAREMMMPALDWLWELQDIIPVDRDGKDTGPTREAIRHVRDGGILGIFPEGRIVVPPREIRPFHPGIGLIVARTKAPVLVCWVSGTPDTNKLGESLMTRSHARVEFLELIDFGGEKDAETISRTLRERIAQASGWPLNDEPVPPATMEEAPPFPV